MFLGEMTNSRSLEQLKYKGEFGSSCDKKKGNTQKSQGIKSERHKSHLKKFSLIMGKYEDQKETPDFIICLKCNII